MLREDLLISSSVSSLLCEYTKRKCLVFLRTRAMKRTKVWRCTRDPGFQFPLNPFIPTMETFISRTVSQFITHSSFGKTVFLILFVRLVSAWRLYSIPHEDSSWIQWQQSTYPKAGILHQMAGKRCGQGRKTLDEFAT